MTAATVIARNFCDHHPRLTSNAEWPCHGCVSKAKAALHELAGQGVLFDVPIAPRPLSDPDADTLGVSRRNASDTSAAARFAVMPKTGSQRRRILDAFLDRRHLWTDDELIVALGMTHQSVGPRRGELVAGGWLKDSGLRRPTRSGADAIVWTLTSQASRQTVA